MVAIVLAGCLAAGVILASDVFSSGSNLETLLFGSLLLVDNGDIALAAAAAAATLLATGLLGRRWLARGFDPDAASGARTSALDALLLGLIALATTAALTVTGALLVAALFVVPAATARLLTSRLSSCQLASVGLVAAEGTFGLWLSVKANAPPGATIACVSGAVFALVAAARAIGPLPRPAVLAALAASAALAVAVATGCGAQQGVGGNGPAVVATTTQIGDWVRQVGGPQVSVDQVLQPNTDPHDYEPRPHDVEAAADARLVFANGDGLDGWIEQVVSDSGGDAEVVYLGGAVPLRLPGVGSGSERYDPHWWSDPRDAAAAVRAIERRLAAVDPPHRGRYERNADAYLERIRTLDHRLARCFASIPPARRRLVTDHDAFGYFARRYGIDVAGAAIPAQATEAQPSARDLRELVQTIEAEGVSAIFPESSLSPKVADAIARQTGARFGEALYGDALGPSGSSGATYLGMEQANADAMARGFTEGRRGCG